MSDEKGSAEIVGVILLIGIIITAFGIFAALYLPSIKPDATPQVKLNIACSNTEISDQNITDYPCMRGAFGCHAFNNHSCEEDCRYRDYSSNPQYNSEDSNLEVTRCLENCEKSTCSDLSNCKLLYLCHNGGDSLKISDLKTTINGVSVSNTYSTPWRLKQGDSIYSYPVSSDKTFRNGDLLLIPNPDYSTSVKKIHIIYTLPSGREVTLVMNQYGVKDITK